MSEGRQGRVLDDVMAWVVCLDSVSNAKAAITARIDKHGGKVVARLGKEVSHVVWERRRTRKPSEVAQDEGELLDLFRRLEKMDYPPVVVSPLWVEESIKAGRRLVERKYLVKKPTESLLGRTPGSGAAAKKRKRPAAAVLPKPAEAYELDDLVFSSTQQMHNDLAGSSNMADVSSPRDAGANKKRGFGSGGGSGRGAAGSKQQRGGGGGGGRGGRQAGGMPRVAEGQEVEEEDEQQQQAGADRQQSGGVGTETQAVADIMVIDLPDEEHGHTPGGGGGSGPDEDELDTPLALRFAKSSAERAAARASSGGGNGGDRRAAAGGGGGGDRRSRLALASGPHQLAGGVAAAEGGEEEEEEADAMQLDDEPQQQPAEQQAQADKAAAAAKGVAERFSVRQLVRHPERPVLVRKGTPLPSSLPSSPVEAKPAGPLPIPLVERVTSPWTLAEQIHSQPSQAAAAAAGEGSGRLSISQPAPKAGGRRSLLAVSHSRHGSGGSGGGSASGTTPASLPRPAGADGGKLPTPWSTLRAWDGRAGQLQAAAVAGGAAAAAAAAAMSDENQAGPPQQPQAELGGKQQQAEGRPAAGSGGGRRPRHTEPAAAATAAAPAAAVDDGGPGPSHGCIGLTSVDGAVVDLARSAARRLRGMRLCPEGKEEGHITHLVVGDERRTLKLMLAVANGAWLLSPQWVTASLEAGRWLPESQFPAKVRFEAAAERARSLLEVPDALPLLHEHSIYIHLPEKARKLMGANVTALRRVALVLGSKLVAPKACTMCVVVGGGSRPPHLPKQAVCVKEEWLLQAAERFEQPDVDEFLV